MKFAFGLAFAFVFGFAGAAECQSSQPLFSAAEPYQLSRSLRSESTDARPNCFASVVDDETSRVDLEICAFNFAVENAPPPRQSDANDHWVVIRTRTSLTWKSAYLATLPAEYRQSYQDMERGLGNIPYQYSLAKASAIDALAEIDEDTFLSPRYEETPVGLIAEGLLEGSVSFARGFQVDDEEVLKAILLDYLLRFDNLYEITDVQQRCYIANLYNLVPREAAASLYLGC